MSAKKTLLNSLFCTYAYIAGTDVGHAQTRTYTKTQATTGAFNHESPSVNNSGDIVWSQQVGGFWQVYILRGGVGAPTALPGQQFDHNNQFPTIDDPGHVMYLKDGVGQGVALAVILNSGGTEGIVEFSSRNMVTGQHRDAGMHFGIASNGTTISYDDFLQFGFGPRRFNVSGVGQLSGDFTGYDFPDINRNGTFVYSSFGTIFSAPVSASNSPTIIAGGDRPRIADVVAPATSPEVVYISGGAQVVSTLGGVVDAGSWADVNNAGTVVYERAVSGFNQIFVAKTAAGGTINVTTNAAAATFTVVGPVTYTNAGTSFTQANAPVGAYTTTFGSVNGFVTPAPQTQTLLQNGSITFNAIYTACGFMLSPPSRSFNASGGTGSFDVVASGSTCSWAASAFDTWITITSASIGTGNGTVRFSIGPNTASATRAGIITVGPQTFTVTQTNSGASLGICVGTSCTFSSVTDVITLTPSHLTHLGSCATIADEPSTLALTIGCFDTSGGAIVDSCTAHLMLNRVPLSGGHAHDDSSRPVGAFDISSGDTKTAGLQVIYTAPEVSGPVMLQLSGTQVDGSAIMPKNFTINVAIGGLTALPPGGSYTFIGGSGTPHPDNHYGQSGFNSALIAVANDYTAAFPGQTLSFNDMSLVLGGRFDIQSDWLPPHCEHRLGTNLDLRLVPRGSQRDRLYTIIVSHGLSVRKEGSPPHWHLSY